MAYSEGPGARRAHTAPPPVFHLSSTGAARDLERRAELPVPERAPSRALRGVAELVGARAGLDDPLAAETTPLDAPRALVDLEAPDRQLLRPPPCRRLRPREARPFGRLRRALREDLPPLSTDAAPDPAQPGRQPPHAPSIRRPCPPPPSDAGPPDGLGILVSAAGFGFVYGLTPARTVGGFSPVEAMAMSLIAFAGAAQFAAIGYVVAGIVAGHRPAPDVPAQRPPRPVLPAALAPWFAPTPRPEAGRRRHSS